VKARNIAQYRSEEKRGEEGRERYIVTVRIILTPG
jgi:hypothetical protein